MNNNDWIAGDLLRVVRPHSFAKGNPDGLWPNIFVNKTENGGIIETPDEVPADTIVVALDYKPSFGKTSFIRVLHEDGVWVANSNYLIKESCSTAKKEKY